MTKKELQDRTKKFAINVIQLTEHFPEKKVAEVIKYQILKSSTSTAANYRAACRAKSTKDFINKIKIVEEEIDETLFWLEIIDDINLVRNDDLTQLLNEAQQLVAIFVATLKTIKEKEF